MISILWGSATTTKATQLDFMAFKEWIIFMYADIIMWLCGSLSNQGNACMHNMLYVLVLIRMIDTWVRSSNCLTTQLWCMQFFVGKIRFYGNLLILWPSLLLKISLQYNFMWCWHLTVTRHGLATLVIVQISQFSKPFGIVLGYIVQNWSQWTIV